jgi:hypothetical protein
MEKIKVLYIMGVGRSGSTILGVVLGNLKDYFFGGEMHLWIESKGVPTEREHAIKYWEKIAVNIPDRDDYFNTDFDKKLEFHTTFPALFGSHQTPIIKKFHKLSGELFASIKKVSGCDVIVDSSHYPLRAYWLNKNPALDMHYIYLYRNPVDAVHALMKKDVEQIPKNFFSANIYLFWVSLISNIVYLVLPKGKKLKVRYEDLIKNPNGILSNVQQNLNTQLQTIDLNNLSTGYIFRANRIRLYKTIKLESTLKRAGTNIFLKALIYIIHFPFMLLNPRRY